MEGKLGAEVERKRKRVTVGEEDEQKSGRIGLEEGQKRCRRGPQEDTVSDSEHPDAPMSRVPLTSLATPSAVEETVSGISAVEVRLHIPSNGCTEYGLWRLHLLQECAVFPQCGLHGECV